MANTFWANPTTDPKRAYRWLLYLNAGNALPSWVITKVSQPSFEVSEKGHQFINHKFYYPGRVTWTEVKFTLVDPIDPDASAQLQKILHQSGYVFPDQASFEQATDTISKGRAIRTMPKVKIQLLGASNAGSGGNVGARAPNVGSWSLNNAWIKNVTFSELSYDSDDLVNAEVTLRYDWAVYTSE